jgi:hypothetical protein
MRRNGTRIASDVTAVGCVEVQRLSRAGHQEWIPAIGGASDAAPAATAERAIHGPSTAGSCAPCTLSALAVDLLRRQAQQLRRRMSGTCIASAVTAVGYREHRRPLPKLATTPSDADDTTTNRVMARCGATLTPRHIR